MFPDGIVDRTLLRGTGGESPCITDSLAYITGGRFQFGTLNVDFSLGHAVVLQRIDTLETWMGVWKDGIQSWNSTTVFGTPNQENPLPYKRWSAWRHEPDTPEEQLKNCKITWNYDQPELLQRLRDLKDNLKYLKRPGAPSIDPNKSQRGVQLAPVQTPPGGVFSHPLEESFQIKKVPGYKWEYPHCEPTWVPRLDMRAKWAPFTSHPEQLL